MKWNYQLSLACTGGLALILPLSAFAEDEKKAENKDAGRQHGRETSQKGAPQASSAPAGKSGGTVRNEGRGNHSVSEQGHGRNVSAPSANVRNTQAGAAAAPRGSRNQQSATTVVTPSAQSDARVTGRGSRNQQSATTVVTPSPQSGTRVTGRGLRNQQSVTTVATPSVTAGEPAVRGSRYQRNGSSVGATGVQGRQVVMTTQQTQAYQQQYNRGNQYGGLWFAGNTHSDWNRSEQHSWNNHNYRWYENGWLIIDGGYDPYYATRSGSLAARVQSRLADRGYYEGPIDGDIGPGTRHAIVNYQRDYNLRVTGRISDSLLESLQL